MIKTLGKVAIKGTYLGMLKAIHDSPTAGMLNGGELKAFSLWSGSTRMSTFTTFTFIQRSVGSPSHSNQTRKSKRHLNWKGRN